MTSLLTFCSHSSTKPCLVPHHWQLAQYYLHQLSDQTQQRLYLCLLYCLYWCHLTDLSGSMCTVPRILMQGVQIIVILIHWVQVEKEEWLWSMITVCEDVWRHQNIFLLRKMVRYEVFKIGSRKRSWLRYTGLKLMLFYCLFTLFTASPVLS